MIPELARQNFCREPFAYNIVQTALESGVSDALLDWFETSAPWQLKVASFYEQYEFSILDAELPDRLKEVFSSESIASLRSKVARAFETDFDDSVDVTVHKLVSGQRIRIHNDYIPGQETHRLLIQLNRGWSDSNGGALIFFNSPNAKDVHRIFRPHHNTGVLFEISPKSFHAVSPIVSGERYTLVFSFYKA